MSKAGESKTNTSLCLIERIFDLKNSFNNGRLNYIPVNNFVVKTMEQAD